MMRKRYWQYMKLAKELCTKGRAEEAFRYLELAHILGQRRIIPHTRTHWWMLKIGYYTRDYREILGQIPRMIASVVFSRLWVPRGNTGGANVSAFKCMKIPAELREFYGDETGQSKVD